MIDKSKLWLKEYQQKGIPSSFKTTSSVSMDLLYEWISRNNIHLTKKVAADLGCGKGRNTFSLIEQGIEKVYAIDFVPELIEGIKFKTQKKKLSGRIIAICHDLTKPWPLPTNSLNLTVDIFCFKHQIDLRNQQLYKKEIYRTLKKHGILLIDLASVDDGYYGSLPKQKIKKGIYKITDPKTGVGSLLYTKESLINEFSNHFKLEYFQETRKEDIMHGKLYPRISLKFIFKKE